MRLATEYELALTVDGKPSRQLEPTAIFPLPGQRAWLAGRVWPKRCYWLARAGPEGLQERTLPDAFGQRLVALTGRSPSTPGDFLDAVPFAAGGQAGFLLGNHELQLFAAVDAEPTVIAIEGGEAFAEMRDREGQIAWYPLRCGHAEAGLVPVVFASPAGGLGAGRHVALLEVDVDSGRACWRGLPQRSRPEDYSGSTEPYRLGFAEGTMDPGGSPLVLDCRFGPEGWLIYAGGHDVAYWRFGLAPSVLARHGPDLALRQVVHRAEEESFGRLCASGERLILSPLRGSGPARGKQSVYRIDRDEVLRPKLPRGYGKFHLADHGHGHWWLLDQPWRMSAATLLCCAEG